MSLLSCIFSREVLFHFRLSSQIPRTVNISQTMMHVFPKVSLTSILVHTQRNFSTVSKLFHHLLRLTLIRLIVAPSLKVIFPRGVTFPRGSLAILPSTKGSPGKSRATFNFKELIWSLICSERSGQTTGHSLVIIIGKHRARFYVLCQLSEVLDDEKQERALYGVDRFLRADQYHLAASWKRRRATG